MKYDNKKMFYFFVCCIVLAVVIIGATYAYFVANVTDNSIAGKTESTSFGLSVERVTFIDLELGLVPMRNNQSPNAAIGLCEDDRGYAGCQIYKITINMDSDDENAVLTLDGYITTTKVENLETRYTRVYYNDGDNEYCKLNNNDVVGTFCTEYTTDSFSDESFDETLYIKTGDSISDELNLNQTDDYDSLFVKEDTLTSLDSEKVYYVMIWVYDNDENQNELQGVKNAFSGNVIFITSEGHQIKASFN